MEDKSREYFSGYQSIPERENCLLAHYAIRSEDTTGRKYAEPVQVYRGPFQRDRDRIIHTAAYRRLSHKTQVFTNELGDYHRNRLTHTLEVCSIARTIARALRLNEDLVEAMALMHDIGHPPFGHSGEDVLDVCLADDGGFSHNRHALRIVEVLEQRYPDFPGLNLSMETLEGQQFRAAKKDALVSPSLEAQVVDAADSIAYDGHDADDALELGLLDLSQLKEVCIWNTAVKKVSEGRDLSPVLLRRAVAHELIDVQVQDLLENTLVKIERSQLQSVEQVKLQQPIVGHSDQMMHEKNDLESFLMQNVYRHPSVIRVRDSAQSALQSLFKLLKTKPQLLPVNYARRSEEIGLQRTIGDYIAGMTDRFAWREHARLLES